MDRVTLKQLRYFEALARHQHFGRAAESCGITQPALSVQIRDLEAALGLSLVERASKNIRLTSLGSQTLLRIQDILRSLDDMGTFAERASQGAAGMLRLGVIPTIAPYLLPDVVAQMGARRPDLEIRLRESQTATLIQELEDGLLDLALVALPISGRGLGQHALYEEEFVLVRPLAEAADPIPSAEQLRLMRLLLLEEGHCLRDQALEFCSLQSALGSREVMDASSLSTLVQMVGVGLGVTLLPETAVPVETLSAQVSVARFAKSIPRRTIGLVWRGDGPAAQILNDLNEIIPDAAKQKLAPPV